LRVVTAVLALMALSSWIAIETGALSRAVGGTVSRVLSGAVSRVLDGVGATSGSPRGPAWVSTGIWIAAPSGWQAIEGENGQTIALIEEDLFADTPQGPRIRVRSSETFDDPLLWASPALPDAAPELSVQGPLETTVGSPGHAAVEVVAQEAHGDSSALGGPRWIVTRYVIVPLEGARAVLIMMEAPAEQYEAYRPTFDAALQAAQVAR